MFFNKEDRRKLDIIYNYLESEVNFSLALRGKPISRLELRKESLPETSKEKESGDINVYGGNSYDSLVEAEEEQIIDSVAARLTQKGADNYMYPEEAMTAEELEGME